MRRLLLLLVALALAFSGVAETVFKPAGSYRSGERVYSWGPIKLEPYAGGAVSVERLSGKKGADHTDPRVYTYSAAVDSLSGLQWNPLSTLSDTGREVARLLSPGLYSLLPAAKGAGYALVPELAAALPEDVTAEYAGRMGIKAGDEGLAWRIALNPDARWHLTTEARAFLWEKTGDTPTAADITADDYIYSLRRLLDARLRNSRADSFCDALPILNARGYMEAGKVTYQRLETDASAALKAGLDLCLDMDFWDMTGAPDRDGNEAPRYVSVNDATPYLDPGVEDASDPAAWRSAKELYETCLAEGMPYEAYQREYLFIAQTAPPVSWEDVGLVKVDDHTLDLILESPLTDAAFALPYALSDGFLVYAPLFEACEAPEDDSGEIASAYGTSVETTAACGPYTLTRFDTESQLLLERNRDWYGYDDEKHLGMYQTDVCRMTAFPDHAAAREALRAGQLDALPMEAGDAEDLGDDVHIQRVPIPCVTRLVLNTDYAALLLHANGSQVQAVDTFREGLSWVFDRSRYAERHSLGGIQAMGMLDGYICDPFTGTPFRESDPGRMAMARVYGGNSDPCDPDRARNLLQLAYDKAVAAGLYDGLGLISIELSFDRKDDSAMQVFNDLNAQLKAACEGTAFQDRLSLSMRYDPSAFQNNYNGRTDAVFAAWRGSPLLPFDLLDACYTDAADGSGMQMEYGYNAEAIRMTFDCDGKQFTASLRDWARWAGGEAVEAISDLGLFSDYSYGTRTQFLAGMEACYLNWHPFIPLYEHTTAMLLSNRVTPGVSGNVNPLCGDGGLAFLTYTMDDETWEQRE